MTVFPFDVIGGQAATPSRRDILVADFVPESIELRGIGGSSRLLYYTAWHHGAASDCLHEAARRCSLHMFTRRKRSMSANQA